MKDSQTCFLEPPANGRQRLLYTIFTKLGTRLPEPPKEPGCDGYNPICTGTGLLGFQYNSRLKPSCNAEWWEVSQVALSLVTLALSACDRAYKDGFEHGEKIGVSLGKDLLKRLGEGDISTKDFEARDSIYEERRDGPLYLMWPG